MEKSNNDLFELMTKMYSDMNSKMDKMDDRMDKMDGRLDKMDNKIDKLHEEVKKNSISIERIESNIKLLAEGHQAIREEFNRKLAENNKIICDRIETLEAAMSAMAKDIKIIKRRVSNTEDDIIVIQDYLKLIK